MPFRWTPSRLQRLRSAVRSYNAAITRRERELEDEGMGSMARYLPSRVTVDGIRSLVHSVNDFRRIVGYRNDLRNGRTSVLTRVLRSADPAALEFTETAEGVPVTRYSARERSLDERAIARQRRRSVEGMSSPLYPGDEGMDLDGLTPPEFGAATADTDLMPEGEGEPDPSDVDVDPATVERWRQEDARAKRSQTAPDAMYDVWMDVWTNPLNFHGAMPGYQDVVDAMQWLVDNRVDVLNKMFNTGRDEMDPQYITESGRNTNPYVNIPYETRHSRAVRYITGTARQAGWEG